MPGRWIRPTVALRCGLLLFASLFAGCTTWGPEPEPVDPEPVVVEAPPAPVAEPAPEPEPEPVVAVPVVSTPPPIAIVLSSGQPAYRDVAVELAAYFTDHAVYDLSDESLPPIAVLRSINDSDSSAVVAIGLRAAQSSIAASDVPVVFSQVFNYQEHALLTPSSRGIAAVAPVEAQLAAWKKAEPDVSRIGIIIGEGHEQLLDDARKAAQKYEVELDIRNSNSDQETLFLYRRMIGEIDGFWLFPDSRVLSTRVLDEIFADAKRHDVTVVVPSDAMLKLGAAISISTVAADIAASIAKVLRRIHAGDIDSVAPITGLSEVRVTIQDD